MRCLLNRSKVLPTLALPCRGPHLLPGAFFTWTNSGSAGQSGSSSNLLCSAAKALASPARVPANFRDRSQTQFPGFPTAGDTAQALSGPVSVRWGGHPYPLALLAHSLLPPKKCSPEVSYSDFRVRVMWPLFCSTHFVGSSSWPVPQLWVSDSHYVLILYGNCQSNTVTFIHVFGEQLLKVSLSMNLSCSLLPSSCSFILFFTFLLSNVMMKNESFSLFLSSSLSTKSQLLR